MTSHSFHIPVMGTGFTIDTPIKVARFGISSTLSIMDDHLVERMRDYYSKIYHESYAPILTTEEDSRARRITEYLNLLGRIVKKQIAQMKSDSFKPGSELCKYFELLSETSPLKKKYRQFLDAGGEVKDPETANWLKNKIVAGEIDVNIMTKVDRDRGVGEQAGLKGGSDALSALRGFAKSELSSSVVLSAGVNPRLFSYVSEFESFFPDESGVFNKKIILKVSEFRSAAVQAKIFAKKGIWVSEFRIESGLNCGGHAFATAGHLIGPVLEEFRKNKEDLFRSLSGLYAEALLEKNRKLPVSLQPARITAQGGVGTGAEHEFLLRYFELSSVGWGSPFLLVPEATTVDQDTLAKLLAAEPGDIYLSQASPLGIPIHNLKNSASEEDRRRRIEEGSPGSPCVYKFLAFNTEFGKPLCVASSEYQRKKLAEIKEKKMSPEEYDRAHEKVVAKACICRELGEGVMLAYGMNAGVLDPAPAVCPGPNLVYFSKVCSLEEMVNHIYGRANVLDPAIFRPHVLISELKIYVDYLKDAIAEAKIAGESKDTDYFTEFKRNLLSGIDYYQNLQKDLNEETPDGREKFLEGLLKLRSELESISTEMASKIA